MNRFFIAILVLTAVALVSAPAAAQDVNVTVEGANKTDGCTDAQPIDNHTAVCSTSLDGRMVTIVVYSDRPQRGVQLTGPFREGDIPRSTYHLQKGRNTLRLQLYDTTGKVGVTVDTGRTLRGVTVQGSNTLVSGPFDGRDAQTTAVGGALSVALITIVMAVRRVTGRDDEPERIA